MVFPWLHGFVISFTGFHGFHGFCCTGRAKPLLPQSGLENALQLNYCMTWISLAPCFGPSSLLFLAIISRNCLWISLTPWFGPSSPGTVFGYLWPPCFAPSSPGTVFGYLWPPIAKSSKPQVRRPYDGIPPKRCGSHATPAGRFQDK